MKKALITGVAGQDGSYLAKLLLDKGYEVYGGLRRNSSRTLWRLDELGIADRVQPVALELLEYSNIRSLIAEIRPDEIYNLAAQSFVKLSFDQPVYTTQVDAVSVAYMLEVIREVVPEAKFYQASTSEMYGKVRETPQSEMTPFHPRSPYAVAKAYAHFLTQNYREAYGLFACGGILFNHESPLRGLEFVTRKITANLAEIRAGREEPLSLGNMDAQRDWGFAGDYVEGMWRMLQADEAGDYVLATGQTHSVRAFVEAAARALDYEIAWEGEGVDEIGRDAKSGQVLVNVSEAYYRPAEVDKLIGDPSLAKAKLGWEAKTGLDELVGMMAKADYDRLSRGLILQ